MCIVYEAQVNLQVKHIEVTVEASDDAVMPNLMLLMLLQKKKVGVILLHYWWKSFLMKKRE